MNDFFKRILLIVGMVGAAGLSEAELLYSDSFDGGLTNWVGEGPTPSIVDGQLDFNVIDSAGTIWLNRKWSGNIQIEYDVLMLGYRDLNVFWMATDPNNPDDFFAADRSDGDFGNYNSMDLYYVGYGGNRNETTRARKYFDNTRPILEEYTTQPFLLNGENSTYRVRLVQDEGVAEYWIDQNDGLGMQQVWSYDDNTDPDGNGDPYTEGYFGIRGAKTHYRIDNVTVTAIPEPSTLPLIGLGIFGVYFFRGKRLNRIRKNQTVKCDVAPQCPLAFQNAEQNETSQKNVFY
ncbi:DUF6250 domain-containing protein [Pontiellaceae bacterium B1224]|nr:DUF6250 domain-containing protein [Pontiellaceae bacterium B1224]